MPLRFLILLLIFSLGAVGGIWAQAFLLPSLAANPVSQNWQFIKDWNARTQVIAPVQQVTIQENKGIERTIQKVQDTVVPVQSGGQRTGSGLVFTSDGLILTLSTLVPQGFKITVYQNGEALPATILKRDVLNNLALLKIEKTGLQTTGFVGNGGVSLGERVVLLSKALGKEGVETTVNQGIVKNIEDNTFATSMLETVAVSGALLFTLEERVAGLAFVDSRGTVHAISSFVLRTFLGL
tara:strand:+ start:618 stop:1334 length:717 start_codon:yes stop_codon:yes gene_type:complete